MTTPEREQLVVELVDMLARARRPYGYVITDVLPLDQLLEGLLAPDREFMDRLARGEHLTDDFLRHAVSGEHAPAPDDVVQDIVLSEARAWRVDETLAVAIAIGVGHRLRDLPKSVKPAPDEAAEREEIAALIRANIRLVHSIHVGADIDYRSTIVAADAILARRAQPTQPQDALVDLLVMTGCRDREDLEDMARCGKSLLDAIQAVTCCDGPFKGWAPADDPAEIVTDLFNALMEAPAQPHADGVRESREPWEEGTASEELARRDRIAVLRAAGQWPELGEPQSIQGKLGFWKTRALQAEAAVHALAGPHDDLANRLEEWAKCHTSTDGRWPIDHVGDDDPDVDEVEANDEIEAARIIRAFKFADFLAALHPADDGRADGLSSVASASPTLANQLRSGEGE